MKRIDLGQTITIVANIGVIAGIVFLGYEVRQTQTAMQSQAFQARALDAIAWNFEIVKDENLRKIQYQMDTGKFDPSSLTEAELQIAWYLLDGIKVDVDNEHYQYENGFLDPGFYEGVTVPMIRHFAPIWRDLGIREGRPEFIREVDRILLEVPPSSSMFNQSDE